MGTGRDGTSMTGAEVSAARAWAEINAGEDKVLDMFEWKVLEILRDEFSRRSVYHEKHVTDCENRMQPLEDAFVITGPTEDF